MNIRVSGVSFNFNYLDKPILKDYELALNNAKAVFELHRELDIPKLDFLNIGGGFSMMNNQKDGNFIELAYYLTKVID